MSQYQPKHDSERYNPRTAATNNLTWAIAMVLIIAALAIAVVYVMGHIHL